MPFNPEKLKKLVAKSSTVRTGGKGSVRRKKKTVRKNLSHDDKRLTNTLKRLSVRDIPAIEEVNLFKDDGTVIHFASPKVQASIAANTYVVSGNAENKKLQELLPGIISQLGPDNLEHLKKIYSSYSNDAAEAKADDDDDDDVPELEQNFEDATKEDGDEDDLPELV
uniref:Nascent polypeptide-associated complex subunit beta n=1 Tax=Lotharella globosa TaxID=91324 RepID=A0A7S3YZ79_9EUKA|mmetsp:Transcript_31457/g.60669  ORF Transcript_31457/g.60669 Transcript_31457/m.60669 type:complete len:167 (+) Transcript_31457:81-581(+)